MVSPPSTPANLPDDIRIYCFVSRLHSLPLSARPASARPALFRLFTDILSLIPPPPLVDAICTAIDAALHQDTQFDKKGHPVRLRQTNAKYATEVGTSALTKALCDLVALGAEYASAAVFGALRYCVSSAEFNTLYELDSTKLLRLCDADESGVVRRAAHELHVRHNLPQPGHLPFPKPNLPLDEECLHSVPYLLSPSSVIAFFLTAPAGFDVDGRKITFVLRAPGTETVVVYPTIDHVCAFHFLFFHQVE
jgi:hypothetical protein